MTRPIARLRTAASLLPVLLLSSGSLVAQQYWAGPRASGMGGAQVAAANDSTALWSNPAGLGVDPKLDFSLFASALATDRGSFTSTIDTLSGLDFGNLTPAEATLVLAALASLSRTGVGAVGSGVAGLAVGERGLSFGIGEVLYAGVAPSIDLVHVSPPQLPSNTSGVNSIGLEAREIRLGYAYGFYGRTLLVGTTVRYIFARTYYAHTPVTQLTQDNVGSIIVDALKHNEKSSNGFTFDVGATVNVISTFKLGIMASSLTEPKFDMKQGTTPSLTGVPAQVKLPRTVRIGGAVTPISALTIAIDYDLVASDTLIPNTKSQQFSGGFEVKLPIFSVRAGAWRDFKAIDPHWGYTVGFGLNFTILEIDAAAMLSPEGGLNPTSTSRKDVGASIGAHLRF